MATEKELLATMEQRDRFADELRRLRNLMKEHPASDLPDDDRRVMVWVYGNWHIGKHRPVNGWHVGMSDNLPIEAWQELPPSRDRVNE